MPRKKYFGLFFLYAISALLLFSAGCVDSPQNHLASEINITPLISQIRNGDDFPVFVQINGSPQQYNYLELRQQNYTIIPILYPRDSPDFIYRVKLCWAENIAEAMDVFLNDPFIKQQLRNGSVILGLDYHIREHCIKPICSRCEWYGPELHILTHNTTERYILLNASSNAPSIKGPFY